MQGQGGQPGSGRRRRNPNAPVEDVQMSVPGEESLSEPPPLPVGNSQAADDQDTDDFDDGFFDDSPITLQPTDPIADEARKRMRISESVPNAQVAPLRSDEERPSDPFDVPAPDSKPPFQFNIRHILIANVALAVVLALLQAAAPQLIAGMLGLVAFGVFLGVTVYQPDEPRAYLVAWSLLVIYILMACVALLRT